MLPGSMSGSVSGSGRLSGSVSGSGSCDFVSGSGSCDFMSGSGSCDFMSGSGSCDFVSGSGSCDFVSAAAGSCYVSGSGSCSFVSDVSVVTLRQDVGFQKCRLTATSNRGGNATHILSWRRRRRLAPVVVAGAELAKNLLEIKRLDKPEAINSLSPSGRGAAT
jgi:hypothetical protein